MRLIDADKIKQSVTNEMLKAELNSPIYCTLECVIADIDKQPTAYDVDKVVKKLEELREMVPVNRLLDDIIKDKPKELGQLMAYRKAIEIVKSGGIE